MWLNHSSLEFHTCRTTAEKVRCRDFSFEVMRTPRYGLTDLGFLEPELWNVDRYTYIAAKPCESSELIATLRLDFEYDLSRFQHLSEELIERWDHRRVAEGGHYRLDDNSPFHQVNAYLGAFALSVKCCDEVGVDTIYAELRGPDRDVFSAMGWEVVGPDFAAKGWDHRWWPMAIRLDLIRPQYLSASFATDWRRQTGVPFNAPFWRRVESLVAQVNQCRSVQPARMSERRP